MYNQFLETIRKVLSVTKVLVHPKYDDQFSRPKYDIALIKVAQEVDLQVYTPVCLPSPGQDFTGKTAWVYGQ